MFFPPLRVDVMVSLIPAGETVLDEGAKHAMLLVEAVKERTDMTMLAENTLGRSHRIRGSFHLVTLTLGAASQPSAPTGLGPNRQLDGLNQPTPAVRQLSTARGRAPRPVK
jgi:hypothetical protein